LSIAQHEDGRAPRGIPQPVPGEFDYVGVIFGTDLTYDYDAGRWVGDPAVSYDTVVKRSRERFVDLVKNTYRVLLTRGMLGCYVCFLDEGTERFVRSRMERAGRIGPASAAS
jgi:DUF2075 family protein